jgi:sugar (pentulose or hexulose) kinase
MKDGAGVLLGIDVGTSELKAALFEAGSGVKLASTSRRLEVRVEADGTREQQPSELIDALRQAAPRLRFEASSAWGMVAGIGLAAQGGSAILCEKRSGRALTPMQLWNDTRPLPLLKDIASRRPEGYWQHLSRLPEPGAGLARITWLRQQYPDLVPILEPAPSGSSLRKLHPSVDGEGKNRPIIYSGAGEYVFFALTGQWRQDAGNALQIGCYSVLRRELVAEPLSVVGVPLDFVAPLRRGHETVPLSVEGGDLLGLSPSIPVAGPYIDHEAGYLSAWGNDCRPLQCSLGTAWVGNFVAIDKELNLPSTGTDLILPSPVDERSLILRVMAAGNLTWDWGLDTLLDINRPAALEGAEAILAENLLPPDGLVSFPWFTCTNPWDPAQPGNGGFLGMTPSTTRADLLRALAAGMAFEFASLFEAVKRTRLVDCVVLSGGASQGSGFRRLLSALFAPLPVFVAVDQSLAGARGSIYAFSQRAARCAVTLVPCPDTASLKRIERQYDHYRNVRTSIRIRER